MSTNFAGVKRPFGQSCLKPLYHSLMVASSYLVWDFKKSMSSLDNLSLLPKQPMSANGRRSATAVAATIPRLLPLYVRQPAAVLLLSVRLYVYRGGWRLDRRALDATCTTIIRRVCVTPPQSYNDCAAVVASTAVVAVVGVGD